MDAALASIFPDEVRFAWTRDPAEPHLVHPQEVELVTQAVAKRKREFAQGRRCARLALAEIGIEAFVLLKDTHRTPIWPRGVVGSISHCEGLCVAVVGRGQRFSGIGVDVEPDRPMKRDLAKRVLSEGELRRLERSTRPTELTAKLIFSIKESVYKCVYPTFRRFVGFQQCEVTLDDGDEAFTARIVGSELGPELDGLQLTGRFRRVDGFVVTGVVQPAAPGSP